MLYQIGEIKQLLRLDSFSVGGTGETRREKVQSIKERLSVCAESGIHSV